MELAVKIKGNSIFFESASASPYEMGVEMCVPWR